MELVLGIQFFVVFVYINAKDAKIQNYLNFIYHEYSQYCLYPSFSIEKIKTR